MRLFYSPPHDQLSPQGEIMELITELFASDLGQRALLGIEVENVRTEFQLGIAVG